uniref:Uncharacterized protein n=1 Tax=Anguilla anguilla TaxID=7936 RepID=A0A0E9T040_ANGAN
MRFIQISSLGTSWSISGIFCTLKFSFT